MSLSCSQRVAKGETASNENGRSRSSDNKELSIAVEPVPDVEFGTMDAGEAEHAANLFKEIVASLPYPAPGPTPAPKK